MADNKQFKRRDDVNVAEDDPLAELTRIMGLQDAAAAKKEPQAAAEAAPDQDVDIDLEQELMSDLGGQPSNVQPLNVPQEPPALGPEAVPDPVVAAPAAPEPIPQPIAPEPAPVAAPQQPAEIPQAVQEPVEPAPSAPASEPKAPILKSEESESFEQMVAKARKFPAPAPVGPEEDDAVPKVVSEAKVPSEPFPEDPVDPAPPAPAGNAEGGRNSLESELKTLLADIGEPAEPVPAPVREAPKPLASVSRLFKRANVKPADPEPEPAEIDLGAGFDAELEDAVSEAATAPDEVPDVATVEVPEQAHSVADDLAIPEFAPEPPAPSPAEHDELEAEFSALFGDQKPATRPAAPSAVPAEAEPSLEEPLDIDSIQLDDKATASPSDEDRIAAASAEIAASAAMPAAAPLESFGPLRDPMEGLHTADVKPPPSRRGMMIAAVVAGVAVLGGVGAFALSFGGGQDTPPAVVKAEPGDVKVKPDDPGGTTVPNQDNKVYEQVSGESGTEVPSQEKLVTTAEKPVDVATRTVTPRIIDPVPGLDNEPVKSEERIVPNQTETPALTNDDVVVVVPRRVKTMIVKPDGTMIPREEVAPAVAPQVTAASTPDDTAVPAETATGEVGRIVTNEDGSPFIVPTPRPERPSDVAANTDEVETAAAPSDNQRATLEPRTAPAPRDEEPAPRETVEPADPVQPVAETPARDTASVATPEVKPEPVAAPQDPEPAPVVSAPRPGEWSVQISSQPSREGAQASYQNLARRFGSVIGGRGVNIVKADIPGKGVYYRVRVPAGTKSDATALCNRYKSAGGSCFIAR